MALGRAAVAALADEPPRKGGQPRAAPLGRLPTPAAPREPNAHIVARAAPRDALLVLGGVSAEEPTGSAEGWWLDLTSMKWERVHGAQGGAQGWRAFSGRAFHSSVLWAAQSSVVVFGGRSSGRLLAHPCAYDLAGGAWRQLACTGEAPCAHAVCTCAASLRTCCATPRCVAGIWISPKVGPSSPAKTNLSLPGSFAAGLPGCPPLPRVWGAGRARGRGEGKSKDG